LSFIGLSSVRVLAVTHVVTREIALPFGVSWDSTNLDQGPVAAFRPLPRNDLDNDAI